MGEHCVDAASRQELERRQSIAAHIAQMAQQFHGVPRVRQLDPRGCRCARLRMQLQHRGGNDAQRAFGADEKLFQVVAGVVLAQRAQPVPYAPVGEHRFQPEHLVARVGPGGVFGEMALVDQAVRAATAKAESDCTLLAINRNAFLQLVKTSPAFGIALLNGIAERAKDLAARNK